MKWLYLFLVSFSFSLHLSDFQKKDLKTLSKLQTIQSNATMADVHFYKALKECVAKSTSLHIPNGIYKLHVPLIMGDGYSRTCSLFGESKQRTILKFDFLDSTASAIEYNLKKIGIDPNPNTGFVMQNFTLQSLRPEQNTALLLSGSIQSHISNLFIKNFKAGIHLFNTSKTYTESNLFENIRIDYCKYAIYQDLDKGKVHDSFHGNHYSHILINVKKGQIAFFNEGYYYNGRFDLLVWTHGLQDGDVTLLRNDGYSHKNIGNITYELYSQKVKGCSMKEPRPKLVATKLFDFEGNIVGPDEDWFSDQCTSGSRNAVIDSSGGLIRWSKDNRYKYWSRHFLAKAKQITTKRFHFTSEWPGAKANSGVYSVSFTGEKGSIATYGQALVVIPGIAQGRRPLVSDAKSYALGKQPYGIKCDLRPLYGENSSLIQKGDERGFEVRCINRSDTAVQIKLTASKIN